MTVRLVNHRKGGNRDDMVAAVNGLKSWWTRHGTQDVSLSQEIAGPAAGQWVVVIWWNDWQSYGSGMAAAVSDPNSWRSSARSRPSAS